jgi:tripartite-type tricarboxylate transporter receptor subunit TctC
MRQPTVKLKRRGICKRLTILAFAVASLTCVSAQAEIYPDKPIRMVVSYPAGGGIDVIARLLAQAMSVELKQSVIVENKGGAAGMIGMESVIRARPDGYTLLMAGNPELTVNPALYPDARYNVTRDLAPIMLVAESPNIIAAHPSVSGTLKDVIAQAKPGWPVTVGTPGTGSTHHLELEVLKAGTSANDVTATTWYGLLAPAGTPPDAVKRLQDAATAVLENSAIRAKLAEMGTDAVGLPGAAFGARIKTELKRNAALVKQFNIKMQ